MTYKQYEKYKDSSIEWIGEIPEHWEVKPLFTQLKKQLIKNEGNKVKNVLSLSYGNIIRRDVESNFGLLPESFETYQIVEDGDIILRLTDLQNDKRSLRVGLVKEQGIITSAYLCLKVNCAFRPEYVYLLLHSYDICKVFYGQGGGVRQSLKFEELKRMPIIIPPIEEQNKIVEEIKTNLSQIDEIIDLKQRQIKILKQYRQSLITETVTKGLDVNGKIKDSGVEWVGQIPEHWDVKKLKYLTRCNEKTLNERTKKSYEFKYIDISSLNEYGKISSELEEYEFENAPSRARRIVKTGDTIISTVRTYLKAIGYIDSEHDECIASTGFAVLTPKGLHDKFLFYAVRSEPFVAKVTANSTGVSYPAINASQLIDFEIVYPNTIQEQKNIADFLDLKTNEIDKITIQIQNQIKELQQYRQSLIYEVVTGKTDIRNYKENELEV